VKSRLHQARAALAPRLAPLIDIQEGTIMPATTDASEWIDVSVAGVRREDGDPETRKHVMVLEAADGQRLPIWVGPFEATALALTLEAVETPRPLTYQLAIGLLTAAGAQAAETRITRLDNDGTFYAVVIVDGPAGRREVDARPSDAVTLATMVNAPIRVDARLFADAEAAECPAWQAYPAGAAELAADAGRWLTAMRRREA
jgi:bifunctional DNase/RNase